MDAIESRLDYVPLGIDPRNGPAIGRIASALRIRRGIQQDDLVIGHFGLILDDLKRLGSVAEAVARLIAARRGVERGTQRIFFLLVGMIVDETLFSTIVDRFRELGVSGRLIHANPVHENDFDSEVASCDAVVCFRRQTRGQLSHVFVRALSLGRPVIVNEASGYEYDSRTLVDDDDIEGGIGRVLDSLLDRTTARDLRKTARSFYEATHRGSESLQQILHGRGHAPSL